MKLVEKYLQVGKSVSGLGTIQDIYGEQFQINGNWYHKSVVYETLMPKLSFKGFQAILYSDDFFLVKVAYRYIIDINSLSEKDLIARFGEKNIVNAKAKMSNFEWLKANLTIAYSALCK